MMAHQASTSPGLILQCRIIGAFQTIQTHRGKKKRNEMVAGIPSHSHLEQRLMHARVPPTERQDEVEDFFVATDELEERTINLGWIGPGRALHLFCESEKALCQTHCAAPDSLQPRDYLAVTQRHEANEGVFITGSLVRGTL